MTKELTLFNATFLLLFSLILAVEVRNGFELLKELSTTTDLVKLYLGKHARYPNSLKLVQIWSNLTAEEMKTRRENNEKIASIVRKRPPKRREEILIVEEYFVDEGSFIEVMDGSGLPLDEYLQNIMFNIQGKNFNEPSLQAKMELCLTTFISKLIKMDRYWRIGSEIGGIEYNDEKKSNLFIKMLNEPEEEYIIQLPNAKILNEEGDLVDPREGNNLILRLVQRVVDIYRERVGDFLGYSENFYLLERLIARVPLDTELEDAENSFKIRITSRL